DDAANAVLEHSRMEVDQQPDRSRRELQVRNELHLMNREKSIEGLDLHDDAAFHEEVETVSAVQPYVAVDERDRFLTLDIQAAVLEVEREASFIRRLEQARSERSMNTDCRSNYRFGHGVEVCLLHPSAFSATSACSALKKR